MGIEYVPPKISLPDKSDPLDMELESIQKHCLKSWSEHEIIARIEHARLMRSAERGRRQDIELLSNLSVKNLIRPRKTTP